MTRKLTGLGIAAALTLASGAFTSAASAQSLGLTVDLTTGETTLFDSNVPGGTPTEFIIYAVTSGEGQLLADNWTRIATQGYPQFSDAGDNIGPTLIGELTFGNPAVLPASGIGLGNVFNPDFADAPDLFFEYSVLTDGGGTFAPDIVYVNAPGVPEPATAGLLVLGGSALLIRRRRSA